MTPPPDSYLLVAPSAPWEVERWTKGAISFLTQFISLLDLPSAPIRQEVVSDDDAQFHSVRLLHALFEVGLRAEEPGTAVALEYAAGCPERRELTGGLYMAVLADATTAGVSRSLLTRCRFLAGVESRRGRPDIRPLARADLDRLAQQLSETMAAESATAPSAPPRQSVFGNSYDPFKDELHERAAILLRELAIDDPRSAQRDRRSGMHYWRNSVASTIPPDGSCRSLVDSYSARVIRLRNEGVLPNELRPLPAHPLDRRHGTKTASDGRDTAEESRGDSD